MDWTLVIVGAAVYAVLATLCVFAYGRRAYWDEVDDRAEVNVHARRFPARLARFGFYLDRIP